MSVNILYKLTHRTMNNLTVEVNTIIIQNISYTDDCYKH